MKAKKTVASIAFALVALHVSAAVYLQLGSRDFNPRGPKLRHHGVAIADPKIDHPVLLRIPEVVAVVRKRSKDGWSRFLLPGLLVVIGRHEIDAEIFLVPISQCCWIFRTEEQPPYSNDRLHTFLANGLMAEAECCPHR